MSDTPMAEEKEVPQETMGGGGVSLININIQTNWVRTTTTIKKDVLDDIKRRGWKISEIISLGYMVRIEQHSLIERMDEMEKQAKVSQIRIERLYKRLEDKNASI
jgi:hypothetical protein